jgi:hypothetical protein
MAPLNPNLGYSHFSATHPSVPTHPHLPRCRADRLHNGVSPTAPPHVPQCRADHLHVGASLTAPPPHVPRRHTGRLHIGTSSTAPSRVPRRRAASTVEVNATRVPAVEVHAARPLLLCVRLHRHCGPPPLPLRSSPTAVEVLPTLSLLHAHLKILFSSFLNIPRCATLCYYTKLSFTKSLYPSYIYEKCKN